MTNVWLTISIEKKLQKYSFFSKSSAFLYVLNEIRKHEVGCLVIYRVMTMEYTHQMKKQLQSLSHYVAASSRYHFQSKVYCAKKDKRKTYVWADATISKRIRRTFFVSFSFSNIIPKRPNIIKNILPVFFSCSFLHRIRAILEHGTTQA